MIGICINDGGYVDLEVGKLYEVKYDPAALSRGFLRIVDESGEDYLYPTGFFKLVELKG
jgi:hypothetical protein